MENYLLDCSVKTFKTIHRKCSPQLIEKGFYVKCLKKMQERVKVLS